MLGIIYKGRDVLIRVGHTGVSREHNEEVMQGDEYETELAKLKDIVGRKIVIASVDRLSPISGIKNKLVAYKAILEQYPQYLNKLIMVQYCTPGSKWAFEDATKKENSELVKEINSKFPNSIRYEEAVVSTDKRLALFSVSEILLVTSLRDGFCLLPFEFMLAKDAIKSLPGTIILSEFAGCVTAMSTICRINPYNISEITSNVLNGIEMQKMNIKDPKFLHDFNYICDHNAESWFKSLVEDIKRGYSKNEAAIYLGAIDKKVLKIGRSFKNLQPSDVEKDYQKSVNRVILLDSEGTVIPIMPQAVIQTTNVVSAELRQILETLCADERNNVFIVSGKKKQLIDKWFSDVDKLGLGAEYGYHFRPNNEKDWRITQLPQNPEWKAKTKAIFSWYVDRTDGSSLEIKDNSLVWVYKECDNEMGEWQAKDLQKTLNVALSDYPDIAIIHGKGFVEVKPRMLGKGELSGAIIEDIRKKKGGIDFIFSIGDDVADEAMFKKINSLCSSSNKDVKPSTAGRMQIKDCVAYTCTVGRKPSHARYYVDGQRNVIGILREMAAWSVKVTFFNISHLIIRFQRIGRLMIS